MVVKEKGYDGKKRKAKKRKNGIEVNSLVMVVRVLWQGVVKEDGYDKKDKEDEKKEDEIEVNSLNIQ